jgi:hypothetical protein
MTTKRKFPEQWTDADMAKLAVIDRWVSLSFIATGIADADPGVRQLLLHTLFEGHFKDCEAEMPYLDDEPLVWARYSVRQLLRALLDDGTGLMARASALAWEEYCTEVLPQLEPSPPSLRLVETDGGDDA